MSDFDRRLRDCIERFTAELQGIVRESAMDAVAGALGAEAVKIPDRRPKGRKPKRQRTKPTKPAASRPTKTNLARRSPEQMKKTVQALRDYVRRHPGQGIEAIAKGMKTTTNVLTRPMSKLLAQRDVRRTGKKRATKYFPVAAAGGGAKTTPARGAKKAARKGAPKTPKAEQP